MNHGTGLLPVYQCPCCPPICSWLGLIMSYIPHATQKEGKPPNCGHKCLSIAHTSPWSPPLLHAVHTHSPRLDMVHPSTAPLPRMLVLPHFALLSFSSLLQLIPLRQAFSDLCKKDTPFWWMPSQFQRTSFPILTTVAITWVTGMLVSVSASKA